MLKKLLLVGVWFPLTAILLIVNLTLLVTSHQSKIQSQRYASPLTDITRQITASAGSGQVLSASIVAADARPLLIENFLKKYGSPMTPYAQQIVAEADKNGLDFRLTTAIAMCESNVGLRMPLKSCNNAWGIAVYNSDVDQGACFENNWNDAIAWVSKFIKEKFYDHGIYDLKAIGSIWAPPSVADDYSWTRCVESFQDSIL